MIFVVVILGVIIAQFVKKRYFKKDDTDPQNQDHPSGKPTNDIETKKLKAFIAANQAGETLYPELVQLIDLPLTDKRVSQKKITLIFVGKAGQIM